MRISKSTIEEQNHLVMAAHRLRFESLAAVVPNAETILQKLMAFQVAIPSWALGTGGTRFGRFSGGGEPATLEQKIEDVALIHALARSAGAVSLHIPWDIPRDAGAIRSSGSVRSSIELQVWFHAACRCQSSATSSRTQS